MMDIPAEFDLLQRRSPLTDLIGPIYAKQDAQNLVLGLSGEEKHCNRRGFIHGGVFATLADIALGYNAVLASKANQGLVTATLNLDFAGSAKAGDWLEITVDVQKVGRTLAFANCYFWVNEARIVRANAVFCAANTSAK